MMGLKSLTNGCFLFFLERLQLGAHRGKEVLTYGQVGRKVTMP